MNKCLHPCHSKCRLLISPIRISWDLVRTIESHCVCVHMHTHSSTEVESTSKLVKGWSTLFLQSQPNEQRYSPLLSREEAAPFFMLRKALLTYISVRRLLQTSFLVAVFCCLTHTTYQIVNSGGQGPCLVPFVSSQHSAHCCPQSRISGPVVSEPLTFCLFLSLSPAHSAGAAPASLFPPPLSCTHICIPI